MSEHTGQGSWPSIGLSSITRSLSLGMSSWPPVMTVTPHGAELVAPPSSMQNQADVVSRWSLIQSTGPFLSRGHSDMERGNHDLQSVHCHEPAASSRS